MKKSSLISENSSSNLEKVHRIRKKSIEFKKSSHFWKNVHLIQKNVHQICKQSSSIFKKVHSFWKSSSICKRESYSPADWQLATDTYDRSRQFFSFDLSLRSLPRPLAFFPSIFLSDPVAPACLFCSFNAIFSFNA